MLNKKNNKSLSLNKETISVLDDAKMDHVRGGTLGTMIQQAVVLAETIHQHGDRESWWHCGEEEHNLTE